MELLWTLDDMDAIIRELIFPVWVAEDRCNGVEVKPVILVELVSYGSPASYGSHTDYAGHNLGANHKFRTNQI